MTNPFDPNIFIEHANEVNSKNNYKYSHDYFNQQQETARHLETIKEQHKLNDTINKLQVENAKLVAQIKELNDAIASNAKSQYKSSKKQFWITTAISISVGFFALGGFIISLISLVL